MATSSSPTAASPDRPATRRPWLALAVWRRLYGSLAWRVLILLGALVVVAQLSTWAAWRLWVYEEFADRVAERVSSQVQLAQALMRSANSPAHMRALASELDRPSLRLYVDPERASIIEDDPEFADIRERLERVLPAGVEVRIARERTRLAAAIRLPVTESTVWMRTLLPPRNGSAEFSPALRVATIGALVLVGAALIVWLVSRPLALFDRALRSSRADLPALTIPPGCPSELRRLAETINRQIGLLDARDRDRVQMLAGVSHDLRAPLARLRMRAELMPDTDPMRAALLRDLRALERITSQFLAFAGGQASGTAERVPVAERLREVIDRYRDQEANVSLLCGEDVGAIGADGVAIERIVSNLVDNALVHGAAPVEVRFFRDGGDAVIEVRDAGPGMNDTEFARARQPFVRLDPARASAGGCGLGLAIVDRLGASLSARVSASRAEQAFIVGVRWPFDRV